MAMDFPGRDQLIAAFDAAVAASDTASTMRALRSGLCDAIHSGNVRLPDCVFEGCREHYARRELYRSPRHGYCVIAMTWNPGQGTPIHDHSGMWCVEAVWRGALEVVQYELREHDDQRYHFVPAGAIQAGTGSAGSLIPPHEHHTIRNASDTDIAVSVHVYQNEMTHCNVFESEHGEWYLRHPRELHLDAVSPATP
ncbi:MAG: cysteine dioxygenase family protein [Xanthomonadales bacterium]|nr:cysteine dioxygenase family protein [Xanthomonadales bacterium]ODU93952.1 MAG: cysteine dioxygenase [Rhodanobacter sp. SCN 66-43]OJY82659.1 MAG: cysteine dioxygenase [Xanthomonadales bacterium 66-474]